MHASQNTMPFLVDLCDALCCRTTPGEENHPPGSAFSNEIDDFLGELLPAFVCVTFWLVHPNGQACVEKQHAAVGPGGEQASVLGWGAKGRIVVLESDVHVFQGRRGKCGRADGKAEAVGLVDVMIGVLPENYGFDGM